MKFTFAPGSTPLPGYTIRRAIHRGGFGEVYYATSDEGRETALKLLQNNLEVELRGVRQCLNLSHPNLVTLFDVKQDDDGDYWIVMEYVPGDTLAEVIRKNPNGLSQSETAHWMEGIAAAVSHLHSRGLVHRDLKPGNVFSSGDTVKVGDVGLSKFIAPSKQSAQTQSVGTVYYMAPEVAQGKYGPAVDQYAMGVIAYELLTGKVPFDGESTGEILLKHLSGQPDLSVLPEDVRPIIGRALAKTPEQRFASVEAFASALDAALHGKAVPQLSPPPIPTSLDTALPEKSIQPPSRRPGGSTPSAEPTYWTDERKGLVLAGLLGMIFVTRMVRGGLGFIEMMVLLVVGTILWSKPPAWSGGAWRLVSHWSAGKVIGVSFVAFMVMANVTGGLSPGMFAMWLFLTASCTAFAIWNYATGSEAEEVEVKRNVDAVPTHYVAASQRTAHERFGDWASSAALAPLAVVVLTAVAAAITPGTFEFLEVRGTDGVPAVVMFAASSLLGIWALLGLGQSASTDPRSAWHTRFVAGLCGVAVGFVTWGLSAWLAAPVREPIDSSSVIFTRVVDFDLVVEGHPTTAAFMLFFGTLFFLRSWVRQAFPMREHRLRIGSVVMSVVVAWLASKVIAFPTGWAMLWAAVVSCGLQSVATWAPEPIRGNRMKGRAA